jgi:MFS family permease
MPICGYLISWFGWPSVFYVTGAVGVLWSLCWFLFIFETPAKHPRISDEERKEIEDAIGKNFEYLNSSPACVCMRMFYIEFETSSIEFECNRL